MVYVPLFLPSIFLWTSTSIMLITLFNALWLISNLIVKTIPEELLFILCQHSKYRDKTAARLYVGLMLRRCLSSFSTRPLIYGWHPVCAGILHLIYISAILGYMGGRISVPLSTLSWNFLLQSESLDYFFLKKAPLSFTFPFCSSLEIST